jgi:hypothetical protein
MLGSSGLIQRFVGRLRFPQLFVIAAVLFTADLVIPDVIPFADEILLALLTAMLGLLRRSAPEAPAAVAPMEKDVTPR